MRFLFSTCLVAGLLGAAFAQTEPTLKWSPQKNYDNYNCALIPLRSEKSFYCLPYKIFTAEFATFSYAKYANETLDTIYQRPLVFPKINNKQTEYFRHMVLNDQLVFFSKMYDGNKRYTIYSHTVEKNGTMAEYKQFMEIPEGGHPNLLVSVDNKRFFWSSYEPSKKASYKISLAGFNADLKQAWTKDIEFTESFDDCQLAAQLMDAEGNYHAVFKIKLEDNWDLRYVVYFAKEQKLVTTPIPCPGLFPFDVKLAVSPTGQICCGAIYARKKPKTYAFGTGSDAAVTLMEGLMYAMLDRTTGAVTMQAKKDIFSGEEKHDKLYYYYLNHILFDADNMPILVSEMQRSVSMNTGGNGQSVTTDYNGAIFTCWFNQDGDPKLTHIVKNQEGFHQSSYFAFLKNNELNVLYVDNTDRSRRQPAERVIIKKGGEMTKGILSSELETNKWNLFCRKAITLNENEVIMLGEKKQDQRIFCKLMFK